MLLLESAGQWRQVFVLLFFPLSAPFLPGVLRRARRDRPMFYDIPNLRLYLYDNRLTD